MAIARGYTMPGEPRTVKGPCFDCDDGASCDCDDSAVCSCHLDDTFAMLTQETIKLPEDLRPNVPPRMM